MHCILTIYLIICIVFHALYAKALCIVFYALYSMNFVLCIELYALYSKYCILCIVLEVRGRDKTILLKSLEDLLIYFTIKE